MTPGGRTALLAAWIASAGAAFLGGRLASPPAEKPAAPATRQVERIGIVHAPRSVGTGLTADDVRLILREELAAFTREENPAAPAPAAEDDPEPLARARALLERAAADGSWSREDAAVFLPALGELGEEAREELLSSLHRALNEGRLRPDGPLL